MTVLLVEDDQDIRMVARMALQHLGGFTVIEAASGAEALDALSRIRPDVVLLDVMMPGMDGTEVLRTMRERPETAAVPVIFLTAKAMPEELGRLRALGARAILTKPFDPAALPGLIRRALEGPPEEGAGRAGRRPVSRETSDLDATAVDIEALRALAGLKTEEGQSLIGELIEMFASGTPDVLQRLREAAGGNGAGDAERIAHSLKGSSGTLGAIGIAEMARRMEALCREGRPGEILPCVDRVDAALAQTLASLRSGWRDVEPPALESVAPRR